MTIKDKQIWENYAKGVKRTRKGKAALTVDKQRNADLSLHPPSRGEGSPSLIGKNKSLSGMRGTVPVTGKTELLITQLERAREKSMRQGTLMIDAKLDLHGLTQIEAFDALTAFLHKTAKAGRRHLLIITGKGRGGAGVLRRNLQAWLASLPEATSILALRPAAPIHGGDGAFYVVLRKK